MNAEKKAKLKTRQQERQLGESVRILNIINLVIMVGGVLLYMLNISPLMTQIGTGLIIAGSVMIVATIAIQLLTASKMRKKK
ncbi:hypothetical protein [Methanolapillus ohkumae]|uniref:Uncharacterized protein n=1 Tax=Methanolapillus ohkumae TaxID=3028298 RepID=A0AA96V8P6_9EURY|nr:hypothetical protein MsAm2_14800 [Methanosarcinaceae archaeon Am2]